MSAKRKNQPVTLEAKFNAIKEIADKKKTVVQVALELKVAKRTVYDWVKTKEKITEQYNSCNAFNPVKKIKLSSRPEVDKALLEWFQNHRFNHNTLLTTSILVEKANEFCILFNLPPTCNSDYIYRWRYRNNIIWHAKQHGESGSVNPEIK